MAKDAGGRFTEGEIMTDKKPNENPDYIPPEQVEAFLAQHGKTLPDPDYIPPEQAQVLLAQAGQADAPAGPPPSKWDLFSGSVAKGLQGLTLGAGDEITAGLVSPIRMALHGESLPEAYDAGLGLARQNLRQVEQHSPKTSALQETIGAVASPVGKLKYVKRLGPLARALVEGGAYGFGAGEGGLADRSSNAALSAATGGGMAVAGKSLRAAGSGARNLARAAEEKALGINRTDLKKAVKTPLQQHFFKESGTNPLRTALKTAKRRGVVTDDIDPSNLYRRNQKEITTIQKKIHTLLRDADKVRVKPLRLKFKNAKAFAKSKSGQEQDTLLDTLDKEIAALKEQGVSTLEDLQRHKVNFNEISWKHGRAGDSAMSKLYKQITRELKETIENTIDDLAINKKLDKKAFGAIRKLNRDEGDLIQLDKVFLREAAADSSEDAIQRLTSVARTSGGFGAQGLGQAYAGHPIRGALTAALLGGLRTRRGRAITSGALNAAGAPLTGAGNVLTAAPNIRGALALTNQN